VDLGSYIAAGSTAVTVFIAWRQFAQKGRLDKLEEKSKALEAAQKENASLAEANERLWAQDEEKQRKIEELQGEVKRLGRLVMLEEVPPALAAMLESQTRKIDRLVETVEKLINSFEELMASKVTERGR
jgi:hypothetical protein